MPNVTVDGTEIEVRAGAMVPQACALTGKEILRFCARGANLLAGLFGFKTLEAAQ